PVNSSMVLKLNESVSLSEQYLRNGELASASLSFEESTLEGITNNIQRARELALQGMSGTNSAESREAISLEVEQIREAVFNLANTRDEQGEYIFAGTLSPTAPGPFKSNDPQRAEVIFDGNESQRLVQIGMDQKVTARDSAIDIFGDQTVDVTGVIAEKGTITGTDVTDADVTGLTINGTAIADVTTGGDVSTRVANIVANINAQKATTGVTATVTLNNTIELASNQDITVGSTGDISATGLTTGVNQITTGLTINGVEIVGTDGNGISSGATAAETAENIRDRINQHSGETGVTASLDANNKVKLTAEEDIIITMEEGGSIAATGLSEGSYRKDDIFSALGNLVKWLNPDDPDNPEVETSDGLLQSLDASLDRVLTIESKIGARINMVERHSDVVRGFVDKLKSNISDINDVDYAEAIAEFNLDRVGIQAAQQAYSKIQGLSLFDYLR
ncbi:MAG: flagellar hook-associated protein FlgL, partial [Gammaproteobacteria bacterium]|nr:flagellar hook-associated protein FlgL [Gammaproteobacteria bacterium]